MGTPNWYKVLEVPNGSSVDVCKAAFRQLAMKHHPDRNGGTAEATAKFQQLNEAWQYLNSPNHKQMLDRELGSAPNPSRGQPRRSADTAWAEYARSGTTGFTSFRSRPFFSDAVQKEAQDMMEQLLKELIKRGGR